MPSPELQSLLAELDALTGAGALPQRIAAIRRALLLVDRRQDPLVWARLTADLAMSLASSAAGDADTLEQAIGALRALMEVFTLQSAPSGWAWTQYNLGVLSMALPEGDRAEHLEQAIAYFRAALEVRTRKALPVEWGATQKSLGDAYRSRIRGDTAANLEDALACYERALEVLNLNRLVQPLEWAQLQHDLGLTAHARIRGERAENLERAITCYEVALEVWLAIGQPAEQACTQEALGIAYEDRLRGDPAANLEHAIAAYDAGLEVLTRRQAPEEWAVLQGRLDAARRRRAHRMESPPGSVPTNEAPEDRARDVVVRDEWASAFSADWFRRAWGSAAERMLRLLWELIDLRTWSASRRLIEEHPDLLDETILQYLQEWAATTSRLGDDAQARYMELHLRVLRGCREVGVEAAFAPLRPDHKARRPAAAGLEPDQEERVGKLSRLVWDFLDAHTWSASRRLVEEHPELLGETAVGILEQWIAPGRPLGEPGARELPEKHLHVLRRCQEVGVEAAFAPLRPDHKALDPPERTPLPAQAMRAEKTYKRTGNTLALDMAIAAWEELLANPEHGMAEPAAAGLRLYTMNELAVDYLDRYQATGRPADLEMALAHLEEVVENAPADFPKRTAALTHLGVALQQRYARLTELTDLERSIRLFESAVAAKDPAYMADRLGNLGLGLRVWYQRTGDLAALDRAVETLRRAVALTPDDAPDAAHFQDDLGSTLSTRFEHTGTLNDLDEGIQALEQAVAATPADAPEWSIYLANLGLSLRRRYQRTGESSDLDSAIALYDKAFESTPVKTPERSKFADNLAGLLQARYVNSQDPHDMTRALAVVERALKTTPRSGDLGGLHAQLGMLLMLQHAEGQQGDPARAVEAFRTACHLGLDQGVGGVLHTAGVWSQWATYRGAWLEAVEAHGYALKAIERLFRTQLARQYKETWLREAVGLSARAAYTQGKAGDLPGAVLTLERGRAMLLSETLERDRANLERLGDLGRGDLADRYRQAADRLAELERGDLGFGHASLWRPDLPNEIRQTARAEFDETIAEIREVAGYERFLDPPTYTDVRAAAGPYPLVYLAAAEVGGLALIVGGEPDARAAKRRPGGEPAVVWLPGLTEDALRARAEAFRAAHVNRRDDPAAWRGMLDTVTGWLWDTAMGPVLEGLGAERRAVLVPAGLLGLLPLHAAWTKDPDCPTGRRYALDEVLLTYAPNARALHAAQRLVERLPADRLLAVDEPRPVQAPSLPSAAHETAAACAAFAPRSWRLRHEQATRQAVAKALVDASVLHLACHGHADLATPLDSSLVLADDQLLCLRELFALRLSARLGVLSACETAVPGTALPDEVVSLPTGLLQAGVAGVIASLWAVPDDRTMLLMVDFYERWRRKGWPPAQALRQAQRWLRDSTNGAKRDRFAAMLDRDDTWLPRATIEACFEAVVLQDPNERGFTDPAGWAAFSYTGT
jgi:CHAT domain-containing protein/tetratricopeptide (TPR) repeat protein